MEVVKRNSLGHPCKFCNHNDAYTVPPRGKTGRIILTTTYEIGEFNTFNICEKCLDELNNKVDFSKL